MGALSGWISNATDRLDRVWSEPLTWVILAGAVVYATIRYRRAGWRPIVLLAFGMVTAWLIAVLAITVYPIEIDFDPTPGDRAAVTSFIPLADSIRSFANTRDRTMTDEEYQAAIERLAEEMGVPPSEVNLDRVVHGTPVSVVLKDTLGNILLFIPLGSLAPAALAIRSWRRMLILAYSVSVMIEASQLFLGLGSLASIDDVIYNTTGAMLGYGLARVISSRVGVGNPTALV